MRRDRQPDRDFARRVALQLLELVPGAPDVVEDGVGALHEGHAERCGDHSAGVSLKQRRAELAFELCDAAREGRLRDAEMARRGAQAAVFGNGGDVAELGEFHGPMLEILK